MLRDVSNRVFRRFQRVCGLKTYKGYIGGWNFTWWRVGSGGGGLGPYSAIRVFFVLRRILALIAGGAQLSGWKLSSKIGSRDLILEDFDSQGAFRGHLTPGASLPDKCCGGKSRLFNAGVS